MVETSRSLDVFTYRDFREYLRDYYAEKKTDEYGFSYRVFSRRLGLSSPNFMKLVIDGDRKLSKKLAPKVAKACGLTGDAARYFRALVAFNQAKNATERAKEYAKLQRYGGYRAAHELDREQHAYYSKWYYSAIRELVSRRDFVDDPKWIGKQLVPQVAPKDVSVAIDVLLALRLLRRNGRGRLEQIDQLLTTGEGPLGHHIVEYHRAMMSLASDSIDRVPREEREISSVTLCVSAERAAEIKRRIIELRHEVLQLAREEAPAEGVIQVNFQMFPLSTSAPAKATSPRPKHSRSRKASK